MTEQHTRGRPAVPVAPAEEPGRTGTPPPERGGGALQRALLRFARGLAARPKTVLLVWAVLIALCTPFAFGLTDVLTDQGASKVVPGTSSARAERLTAEAFPHRSQREVVLVLEADRIDRPEVREFLARLDTEIAALRRDGDVERSSSAYTLHRDAAEQFVTRVRAGADAAGDTPAARRAFVDRELAAGRIPAGLAGLARAAADAPDDAALTEAAAAHARTADWSGSPLAVPAEAAARLLAEDGKAALASVSYTDAVGSDPDVDGLRETARELLAETGLASTAEVHVTGELALIHDTYEKAEADNSLMESVAYVIIFVVLLLFFRAVVPAVLTLLVVGLAMNVSQAALYLLGKEVTLTQFTVTIMTFVMLGAGVDYSMLLSSRYRQERIAGRPPREAAVHATVHAGESMLLAAIAVLLAFGATLLSPVDWIPPLGYGGIIGIPIIFAAALTITPCLLVLLGDRFFALGRAPLSDLEHEGAVGRHLRRTAEFARRRKVAIVVVFLVLTAPFAVIVANSRSTADPVALSPATDSREGFATVAERWGDAAVLPTVVVGEADPGVVDGGALTATGREAVAALTDRLAAVDGVASVDSATHPFGARWPDADVAAMPQSLRDDYVAGNGALRFVVALEDDPYSERAVGTVQRVEEVVAAARDEVGALDVGGATQVDLQYGDALTSSFWQMVVLVSVGVFIMLVIALRSLLVPVRLIATIMLSNVWAVGLTVLIFHDWRGEAIIDDLPIFLTVLMMGLGMDYEIFLITRVRDLMRDGLSQEQATLRAVVDTGRVINAAGLVMAGSLGTMVLSSTLMLQQYGTGLGLAVLLDATVIRMLFVPATLLLLRRYNWWMPSLGRRRKALG
ncbi:MMPL family transporter [Streptomyces sp. Tu 2975]|uniref:MMPL family transporter n=1 Tax=Streptomyces sp. Tu 2975 TaxID=2676871 RepID=UPI00135CD715|nr:MMPL family transporter [Streptomyces sp. Tu 2975]QIP87293.1 MMPL family transporter [Streptomyces sp. Tu 2975]